MKVKLKVCFHIEKDVPDDWDDDMVLLFYNDSSSCKDNLLRDKVAELIEEKISGNDGYSCSCFEGDVELVK
jgi:hypothetical protein